MNVVWFKKDLRVYDNPALTSAMADGPTLAMYCISEWQWDHHLVSGCQRALMVSAIESLESQLALLNVPLVVLSVSDFNETKTHVLSFLKDLGVNQLYFNYQYEVNEQTLEHDISTAFIEQGGNVSGFHDQCAIDPGLITNQTGACYKVFSAFKRAYYAEFYGIARSIAQAPKAQQVTSVCSDITALDSLSISPKFKHQNNDGTAYWHCSELAVHAALNEFVEQDVEHYKAHRDFPSLDAGSSLSPYLAIGMITTRQCIQVALNEGGHILGQGAEGVNCWIDELIWRDFYRHLLFSYPKLSKHKPFIAHTDDLPWRQANPMFETWCNGQTGFPIVDAAMRQLNETGWMHNRLRMIVAMFLTKDLFIDWRLGEAYFMSKLIDGDLASNNGGWQWSASTGVDAAPYFRIFNPVLQSKRFDAEGEFIRKYVPELASLDKKSIHCPTTQQRQVLGYPCEVVDHKQASIQTKAWFKGEAISQDIFDISDKKESNPVTYDLLS